MQSDGASLGSLARVLASCVSGLFTGRRQDEDFELEMATHLDMLTDEHIRRGPAPDASHRDLTAKIEI